MPRSPLLSKENILTAQRLVKFIKQNITEHYTQTQLSEIAHLNREKLRRLFHALYGKTIYACIEDFKIDKAKALLLKNTSIRKTGIKIGFTGDHAVNNFIRFFKKKTGTTPYSWKKRNEK